MYFMHVGAISRRDAELQLYILYSRSCISWRKQVDGRKQLHIEITSKYHGHLLAGQICIQRADHC